MLVHNLITDVRTGGDAVTFTTAWNTAHPVLRMAATTMPGPPPSPPATLPRTPHLHARALRTAAAAVHRARVRRNAAMVAGARGVEKCSSADWAAASTPASWFSSWPRSLPSLSAATI